MKNRFFYLAAGAALLALAFKGEDQIPVLGLTRTELVPISSFEGGLKNALETVRDSILPVLESRQSSPSLNRTNWTLQTIGVGIGATAQVGRSSIWSIGAAPRVRLVFTNSPNPVYPD